MLIVGSSYATEIDNEEFTTDYYLSYDLDNSANMYSKNLDERISQALLTKLMTALILMNHLKSMKRLIFLSLILTHMMVRLLI